MGFAAHHEVRMNVYMFPGQGSQSAGMGEALFEQYPALTKQADDILGYSIRDLCLNNPDDNLTKTNYTQVAMYVVNAISYLNRQQVFRKRPDYVIGHSLGEYNALQAAGVFDFATGLQLVKKRGELMARALPGGMAAVLRIDAEKVANILATSAPDCDIANLNAPEQTVIAGPVDSIKASEFAVRGAGGMLIPLKVGGAFHSRYMQPARQEFEQFLQGFAFRKPRIPVLSNARAEFYTQSLTPTLLAEQITSSVRWVETVKSLHAKECTAFVEVGPGRVLAGLHKRIMKDTLAPSKVASA